MRAGRRVGTALNRAGGTARLGLPVEGEVHLWWSSLAESQGGYAGFSTFLSELERERIGRLRSSVARRRALASRGLLRSLLARYTRSSPDAPQFTANKAGKPELVEPATDLQFNVSHSEDLWVCAVTRGQAVGVDVECVRPIQPLHILPFLAPQERASWKRLIRSMSKTRQAGALLSLWTRKEAYMKARGLGADLPLDAFAVSVSPDLPPRLVSDRRDPQAPQRWILIDLGGFPRARVALAVERPLRSLFIRALHVGSILPCSEVSMTGVGNGYCDLD